MFSPKLQGPSSSAFAEGTSTCCDTQIAILSVTAGAGQSVVAHVDVYQRSVEGEGSRR